MQITGLTDKGLVRSENQDTFVYGYTANDTLYAGVFDGMGGAKAGKFASNMAASMFEQAIRTADPDRLAARPGRLVASSIEQINRRMYEYSAGQREFAGMGTTCVAAILSGGVGVVANVGDSRAYLIDGQQCRQVTRDHSVVQELVEVGEIDEDQAKKHPQRNVITRSLGPDDHTEIDLFEVDVRKKHLLLCSDGLHGYFSAEELFAYISTGRSDEETCRLLVQEACARGGRDNITIILIHCA